MHRMGDATAARCVLLRFSDPADPCLSRHPQPPHGRLRLAETKSRDIDSGDSEEMLIANVVNVHIG